MQTPGFDPALAGSVRETRLRSLFKAVSYRIIGTLTTAGVALAVTGDATTAVAIGTVEPVAKIFIYYLHERAWQMAPRGTIRRLFRLPPGKA